jgi:hypothetical protein
MIEEQIKTLFVKLTHERHYDTWLDTASPAYGLKTPRQMISDGRGEEVMAVLMKLMRGGYMDG